MLQEVSIQCFTVSVSSLSVLLFTAGYVLKVTSFSVELAVCFVYLYHVYYRQCLCYIPVYYIYRPVCNERTDI